MSARVQVSLDRTLIDALRHRLVQGESLRSAIDALLAVEIGHREAHAFGVAMKQQQDPRPRKA